VSAVYLVLPWAFNCQPLPRCGPRAPRAPVISPTRQVPLLPSGLPPPVMTLSCHCSSPPSPSCPGAHPHDPTKWLGPGPTHSGRSILSRVPSPGALFSSSLSPRGHGGSFSLCPPLSPPPLGPPYNPAACPSSPVNPCPPLSYCSPSFRFSAPARAGRTSPSPSPANYSPAPYPYVQLLNLFPTAPTSLFPPRACPLPHTLCSSSYPLPFPAPSTGPHPPPSILSSRASHPLKFSHQ